MENACPRHEAVDACVLGDVAALGTIDCFARDSTSAQRIASLRGRACLFRRTRGAAAGRALLARAGCGGQSEVGSDPAAGETAPIDAARRQACAQERHLRGAADLIVDRALRAELPVAVALSQARLLSGAHGIHRARGRLGAAAGRGARGARVVAVRQAAGAYCRWDGRIARDADQLLACEDARGRDHHRSKANSSHPSATHRECEHTGRVAPQKASRTTSFKELGACSRQLQILLGR